MEKMEKKVDWILIGLILGIVGLIGLGLIIPHDHKPPHSSFHETLSEKNLEYEKHYEEQDIYQTWTPGMPGYAINGRPGMETGLPGYYYTSDGFKVGMPY